MEISSLYIAIIVLAVRRFSVIRDKAVMYIEKINIFHGQVHIILLYPVMRGDS